MSPKVVAFSTRSGMLYAQPYGLHFWECAMADFGAMRANPRKWLTEHGVTVPGSVRIAMTVEEPHGRDSEAFDSAESICNVGGWRPADGDGVFRIVSYMPDEAGADWFRGSVMPRSAGTQCAA